MHVSEPWQKPKNQNKTRTDTVRTVSTVLTIHPLILFQIRVNTGGPDAICQSFKSRECYWAQNLVRVPTTQRPHMHLNLSVAVCTKCDEVVGTWLTTCMV